MKVRKNIGTEASYFYQVLESELYQDIKHHVKMKDRVKDIKEGYCYVQKIQVGTKKIEAKVQILGLQKDQYYCIQCAYPKFTQIISYTLNPLDANYTRVTYVEKIVHTTKWIKLLSFFKSHFYRLKIVQFLNHIEEKAKRKQEYETSFKVKKQFS